MNTKLWNSGIESDKNVARDYKRRVRYYANVLVLEDKANPENEGKVFLWDFGQSIYNLIEEAMMPEDPDEEPVNPFDFWEGADFLIKTTGVDLNGSIVPNYDKKSKFEEQSALYDGDEEKLEKVWNSCHSLQQFVAEDKFKTYDQLKNRLFEVLGPTVGSGISTVEGVEAPSNEKPAKKGAATATTEESAVGNTDTPPWSENAGGDSNESADESDIDYFKKLMGNNG